MKIGSLFHNTFYNLHNGNKWTTLHVMNAVEIYERCKSRKLITSFNRSGLCISYGNMKKYRNDLDKFAISNSSEFGLLILSHFPSITFTISAFDNFGKNDDKIMWIRTLFLVNQVVMTQLSHYFKKLLPRKKWNITEVRSI